MVRELSAIEFEKNLLDLAMHGVDKKILERMKRDFYNIYPEKKKDLESKLPSMKELQNIGLKLNRPNKTVVKR